MSWSKRCLWNSIYQLKLVVWWGPISDRPSLARSDYFWCRELMPSRICIARLIECNRLKYVTDTGYLISSQYEWYEDDRSNRREIHRLLSRDSEWLSMGYCHCWSDQTRCDTAEVRRYDDRYDHLRSVVISCIYSCSCKRWWYFQWGVHVRMTRLVVVVTCEYWMNDDDEDDNMLTRG